MFNRDQIEQVRSAVDIVETIREYVPSLKSGGRSFKGLCPFHSEKTPSFHVHPEKGLFKCFGCGEAGDVIAFVSKIDNLTFMEALQRLAGQAGIVLKNERSSSEKREPESLKQQLYHVLEAARNYYRAQLWEGRSGEAGRTYLAERRISDETAEVFELGFAPGRSESVFETLVKRGFSIDLCQKAGLVSRSSSGRYYDPLYGRLIFPIHDTFGHVVGFGGRIMPQASKAILGLEEDEEAGEAPKYINSPETPVFSKGRLLYGLYKAKSKVLETKKILIVEGYMDVIAVHQAGFPIAVAPLGTALTRDHCKLIKRYTDNVLSFFDADEAGRKAGLRGLEPMLQEDLYPQMVMTADEGDPDEIIQARGNEHFAELLQNAPDFVDYLLRTDGVAAGNSLKARTELAQKIAGLAALSTNTILKTEWIKKAALGLGITGEALAQELRKKEGAVKRTEPAPTTAKPPQRVLPSAEEEFLHLVANDISLIEAGFSPDEFMDARCTLAYQILLELAKTANRVTLPNIVDRLPEAHRAWFMQLTLEEIEYSDPRDRKEQLVRDLRLNKEKRRLAELSKLIGQGQAQASHLDEYKDLLRKVKGSMRHVLSYATKTE